MDSNSPIIIDENLGLVTNIDLNDVAENYCTDLRGGRAIGKGIIFVRDNGTRHRYDASAYPVLSPGIISMIDGCNLYLPSENKEYDLIVGLDSFNNTRICVGNGNSFQELTEYFLATITAIAGTSVTIGTIQTSLGQSIGIPKDYLVNYIGVIDNVPSTGAGLITANTAVSGGLVTLTLLNQASLALSWAVGNTLKIYKSTGLLPDSVLGSNLGQNGSGRGFKYANGATPHTRFLSVEDQQKVNLYYGDSSPAPVMRQPVQIRRGNYLAPGSFTLAGGAWSDFTLDTANREDRTGVSTYTNAGIKYVWICVGQQIYTANDGGTGTWTALTSQTIFSGLKGNLRGIKMLSTTVGFAVGLGGTVLSWDNGNNRWKDASTDVGSNDLYCLSVFSSTNLWVAGSGGKMFKTTDGGASWILLNPPTTKSILTLQFVDANNGYFGAENYGIAKSTNAGSTWVLDGAAGITINSVSLLSVSSGFAVSQDGGIYYKNAASGWTAKGVIAAYSVSAFSADSARIHGAYPGNIYTIANASTSFDITQDASPVEYVRWLASSYYDSTHGFVVGEPGRTSPGVLLFNGDKGTFGSSFGNGWTIQKAGLQPDFVSFGSMAAPMVSGNTVTNECGEGIRLTVTVTEQNDTPPVQTPALPVREFWVKMYVTILYADYTMSQAYQESDPIAQIFLKPSATNKYPRAQITPFLDLALVNKNIIGFRFYHAEKDNQASPVNQWAESAADYLAALDILVSTSGWILDTTKRFCLSRSVDSFDKISMANIVAGAQGTILSNIGHVPVKSRVYLTPRYVVKLARLQGAVIFVDEDDRTLRRSEYSGKGAHMDDSFPAVTVDNNLDNMTLFMEGRGELYGLAVWNDNLLAFHPSELEIRDLLADKPEIVSIDLASKRSITGIGTNDAPNGVTWVGNSGIYMLKKGDFIHRLINLDILNIHDGSLLLSSGVPVVSDSYKKNVLSGYDRFYDETYCQYQQNVEGGGTEFVSYRYSHRYNGKWFPRKFNIGTDGQIKFMYSKKDNSFVIGYATGLLKYPNRDTNGVAHQWEDDVASDGTSANKGIESRIKINSGSKYSLSDQITAERVRIDHRGRSTDGVGSYYGKFFIDQNTAPLGPTKAFPVDEKSSWRGIPDVGMIKTLQIEIGIDSSQAVNVKDWQLNKIEVEANKHESIGVT